MKRIIVDFKKLNETILDLLVQRYPDGYGNRDIIKFRNAKGEMIEAVEVTSEDTVYLVKIGSYLTQVMEDYSDLYYSEEEDVDVDDESNEVDFESALEDYDSEENEF